MSQLFINNNDNGTIKKMITGGMIITEYTYDDADQNITGQKTYVDESKAVKDERLSPKAARFTQEDVYRVLFINHVKAS